MLKVLAILFGIILIAVGLLGFMPSITPDSRLIGLFLVSPIHNIVHLATGIIALLAASSNSYSRAFFQVFGVLYALITLFGFILGGNLIVMQVNLNDNILHLVIAIIALYIGFFYKTQEKKLAKPEKGNTLNRNAYNYVSFIALKPTAYRRFFIFYPAASY